MACRIGITTDPERRKQEWKQKHPTLSNWQILETFLNRTDAQNYETAEAIRRGCAAHAGGDGPEIAIWSVYYFTY